MKQGWKNPTNCIVPFVVAQKKGQHQQSHKKTASMERGGNNATKEHSEKKKS